MKSPSKKTASPTRAGTAPRLADEVGDLARVLRDYDLSEIEIDRHGERIRLRREAAVAHAPVAPALPVQPEAPRLHLSPAQTAAPATSTAAAGHGPAEPAATPGHPAVYITS